jgi:hypothetical protein
VLRLPAKDAPVIEAMKSLSAQYPHYGYRRIRIFLRRRGFELSWSRTHQLWRKAGLLLPRKRPRRCIATSWPRPALGQRAGVRQPGYPGVDQPIGHRDGPERSGQALAERCRRRLQWQVPR